MDNPPEPAPGRIFKRRKRMLNTVENIDRLPPHSIDAEQGVLGCILLSPNDCLGECIGELRMPSEAFYDLRHQTIYTAMCEMYSCAQMVDLVTLQQHLKDRQLLEQVGGLQYLMELPEKAPAASNLRYYTDIVLDKFLLRRLIKTCTTIVGEVYENESEAIACVEKAEREVLALRQVDGGVKPDIKELVKQSINQLEDLHNRQGSISGLSTGLCDLDKATDGLHPGELILLCAFPSMGKTALATQIAEHVAVDLKKCTLIFSLEMSSQSLVSRCICSRARVNMRDISNGMCERDFPKITRASGQIAGSHLVFDDTADLSIDSIRARARRHHQKTPLSLIVIDYMQLCEAEADNREQEIGAIAKGAKQMAKELGVPVILLSQLNDDGKIRESRAPGQHADGVWKLRSPEDYDPAESDLDDGSAPVDLILEKQRNGPRGQVLRLTFLAKYTRFACASTVSDEDIPQYENR